MENEKLILVTNDDGYTAKGIQSLIEVMKDFGRVVVVAPDKTQSGKSHAVTLGDPLFMKQIINEPNYSLYACSGTPADCVKIGLHKVVDRMPDLIVSGINHGSNAAINAIYSGTMAGAREGAFHGIPSVAFSITDYAADADFSATPTYIREIINIVLADGLPKGVALNVNFPELPADQIKGMRACRMTKGRWVEEFEHRVSPHHQDYYWLAGEFLNAEPNAEDTDEWLLANGYVSVVPVQTDLTNYPFLSQLGDKINQ